MSDIWIWHTPFINDIIAHVGARSYLELGVQAGKNLQGINCDDKCGVDLCAASPAHYHMTSKEYLTSFNELRWDVIFVDADHRYVPAMQDIVMSLNVLSPDGVIVVDNILPRTFDDQRMAEDGTVWKAWATLRCSRPDLFMACCESQHGWGVIQRGAQEMFMWDEAKGGLPCYFGCDFSMDWEFYTHRKKTLMNIFPQDVFRDTIIPQLRKVQS